MFFFSFGKDDGGKELSSEGSSSAPFLFISKQSTNADFTVGTKAKLTFLSLCLEVLFPSHCLQRETTETLLN